MASLLSLANLKSKPNNSESLFCKICNNIVWAPVLCNYCKTLYCSYCISLYVHSHKVCQCGQKFQSLSCPSSLEKDLNELKFVCPISGCGKLLIYKEARQHMKTCKNEKNVLKAAIGNLDNVESCESSIAKTFSKIQPKSLKKSISYKNTKESGAINNESKKAILSLIQIIKKCYICQKFIISSCRNYCLNCKENLCNKCVRICPGCKHYYCNECFLSNLTCSKCNSNSCMKCLTQCKKCEVLVCYNCYKICMGCETKYCKECAIECNNCLWTLCDEGIPEEVAVSEKNAYAKNIFTDTVFIIKGNKKLSKGIHKFKVIPKEVQNDCSGFGFGISSLRDLQEWNKSKDGFNNPTDILIGITADNNEIKPELKGPRSYIRKGKEYIIKVDLNKYKMEISGPNTELTADLMPKESYVPILTHCHGRFNIDIDLIYSFR